MKTMIRTLVLALGLISFAGMASAQKLAHVQSDSLLVELAQKDSVQQKLEAKYASYAKQGEWFEAERQKVEAEYKTKLADKSYPPAVVTYAKKRLDDLYEDIDRFQQDAQLELQQYQQELMLPVQEKVEAAIKEVAKEKGFTYVFDARALLVSPPSDDITNLVRKKLGL